MIGFISAELYEEFSNATNLESPRARRRAPSGATACSRPSCRPPSCSVEHGIHPLGGLELKLGRQVTVDVGGDLDAAVAQDLRDCPHRNTLREEQAGAVVPQAVEGMHRHPCPLTDTVK